MAPIPISTRNIQLKSACEWVIDTACSHPFHPDKIYQEICDILPIHKDVWTDFISFTGIVLHDHVQQLYTQWPEQFDESHSIYRPITVIAMTRYIPGTRATNETIFCHIYDYTTPQGKPFECKLHQLIHVIGFQLKDNEYDDQFHIQAIKITPVDLFQCYGHSPIHYHPELFTHSKSLEIKQSFLNLLTRIFSGDELIAEYALLSLFSKIQSRIVGWLDSLMIGNIPLNIILSDQSSDRISYISKKLQQFLPIVSVISMNLDSLQNGVSLTTSLDISCLSLDDQPHVAPLSPLYLADGSLLILDETTLDTGTLNSDGLRNLEALSNLIHKQILVANVSKDFKIEIQTDIPAFVFSKQSGSIMKLPLRIYWNQSNTIDDLDAEIYDDMFVASIREYLTRPRLASCPVLTMDMASKMESLLKEGAEISTKHDEKYQDFHILLTLSRWIAMSEHCVDIKLEHLEQAKRMERERKLRMS